MVVLMRTTARWVTLPQPAPALSALPDDQASLGTPMCNMMHWWLVTRSLNAGRQQLAAALTSCWCRPLQVVVDVPEDAEAAALREFLPVSFGEQEAAVLQPCQPAVCSGS